MDRLVILRRQKCCSIKATLRLPIWSCKSFFWPSGWRHRLRLKIRFARIKLVEVWLHLFLALLFDILWLKVTVYATENICFCAVKRAKINCFSITFRIWKFNIRISLLLFVLLLDSLSRLINDIGFSNSDLTVNVYIHGWDSSNVILAWPSTVCLASRIETIIYAK